MHITRSCVLFLWMYPLAFVKSQECTLQQFISGPHYDSNFDTTGMEASYPGGKQLRVGCNVGYSGFFKLLCIEGKWQPRGTKCQPRSCGHPGDAQFADFHLEKGEDFVFGSQVVYTCHKGYQMVSRKNYRTCMAEGWDGIVPICEAQQCPVINVDNKVQVIGDLEEATYGNVVRFSCKFGNEILDGPSELYCNEYGEWSGNTPTCKAITCRPPEIENGDVLEDTLEYKEHDILHFRCKDKYKRTEERQSKCIKLGSGADWSPTPACELIKCKLDLPPLKGTTYEPAFRNLFLPGDRVRVTCEQRYGIFGSWELTAETTCKDNGEWTVRPVCQGTDSVCFRLYPHVSRWYVDYWRDKITLGETVGYSCRSGYKETAAEATCSRGGWEPNPLCREITCDRRDVQNADITNNDKMIYRYNEQVRYVCSEGFTGQFTLTCGKHGWSGNLRCTGKKKQNKFKTTCKKKNIVKAYIVRNNKNIYSQDETVEYECSSNKEIRFNVTCDKGVWTDIQNLKCPKPKLDNGFIVGPYNDTVYFTCGDSYKLLSSGWWGEAKCNGSVYVGLQPCIGKNKCGPPVIPNGRWTPQLKMYEPNKNIQIRCNEGYNAVVSQLTCRKGQWKTASLKSCKPPPKVDNAVVMESYQSEYLSGSEVTYQCKDDLRLEAEGGGTIRCQDGEWENKNIELLCSDDISLRLSFVHAQLLKMRLSLILLVLANVDVSLSQNACEGTPNVPHAFVTEQSRKAQYQQGDVIYFTCETGYVSGPSIKYACTNEGWLVIRKGTCILKPCELPDDIPNGYYRIIKGEEFVFGAVIQYVCNEGYQMVSKVSSRTCMLDRWTNHVPVCEPLSCEPPPVDNEITVKGLPENDEPILPGRFLTFSCDVPGKYRNGSSALVCGQDGKWDNPFPTCEDITCDVDVMHPNLHATGLTSANETMKIGHVLQFSCDTGYRLDGSVRIQCLQSGQWDKPFPTCSKNCRVTEIPGSVRLTTKHVAGSQLRAGEKLRFDCRQRNHVIHGNDKVECLANGQWSEPFPTCGPPVGCGKPPTLPDGDLKYDIKFSYVNTEKVEYICQPYYTMEGEPFKTCNNGLWTGSMRCLRPCTVNTDDMNRHNIRFTHKTNDKLYSPHKDHITFSCIRGTVPDGRLEMRQQCNDGLMNLPTCVPRSW
uniref:Sushi domain-containing protein n=1 Tax=Anabas testudineus TaxID=64144 RepID=A0A3Q1IA51_ANATE